MLFAKHRQTLSYDDEFVYSYGNRVAKIDIENATLWILNSWDHTPLTHIYYASIELNLRLRRYKELNLRLSPYN